MPSYDPKVPYLRGMVCGACGFTQPVLPWDGMACPACGKRKAGLALFLHEGQQKALASKAQFVVVTAGSQGGKTSFGPHWLLQEIEKKGPGDYLCVTATYPLLNLKMLPEFLTVFERIHHLGTYKAAANTFTFHDGQTRVIFASATNPENIESATAKAAWCDEAGQNQFLRQTWDAIRRRVNINSGRILITTTPYNWGWLKTDVYDRWKAGDKNFDVIQFNSLTNPAFPKAQYERERAMMPDWKFRMFYCGEFTKPAGMVYDSFHEDVCLIHRRPIPSDWPRYVGMDFGGVNTAAMFYAQDTQTGFLYAYREYLTGGLTAAGHAAKLRDLASGEPVMKRVGGARSEGQWRLEFSQAGWPVSEPLHWEVDVGIQRVYGWHKTDRLYVFNDLVNYLDMKRRYSHELDDKYNPVVGKIQDKETFHLLDAERYILSDFEEPTLRGTLASGKRAKMPVMMEVG